MKYRIKLITALMSMGLLTGCMGGTYVDRPPPPDQEDFRSSPPSGEAIWIGGYWGWEGNDYRWVAGRWDEHPRGEWVPGRWEHRGRGYHFINGRWDRHHRHGLRGRDRDRPVGRRDRDRDDRDRD